MTIGITEPGVYEIPAGTYHRDPVAGGSLSSTGARKLLPPSCPALFKHWRENGQESRNEFDLGHAAHTEILGVGAPTVVIDARDYKKKATQEARDAARDAGQTPLLTHEHELIQAIAAAVRADPIAGPLFGNNGPAEQALVWRDPATGVMCRAMLDKQVRGRDDRLIIVDLKTCASAEPSAISKSMDRYGYNQQADFYLSGTKALGLHGRIEPAFVFVFVEKTPPHLVTVTYLDDDALLWGRRLNARALSLYRHCTVAGRWPGYGDDQLIQTELPPWATRRHEDAWDAGLYAPITTEEIAS